MQWYDGDVATWAGKLLPGTVGSLLALGWVDATWPRKVFMGIGGAALSFFVAPAAAAAAGTNEGLAGFLLGLFGMAVVDKIFKTWDRLDLSQFFIDVGRKWFGLGPAEPKKAPTDEQ